MRRARAPVWYKVNVETRIPLRSIQLKVIWRSMKANPNAQRFVDLLRLSTRQAGAVASYLQGKVTIEFKPDEPSPEGQALTAVDLATQDLILHQLQMYWPEVAVDAEEDTELARAFPKIREDQPVIVLDPVDGTYNYTRGSDQYAVMAGLIQGGKYRAAVIHYPTLRATYWTMEDVGCFVERGNEPARRVTVTANHEPHEKFARLLVNTLVTETRKTALSTLTGELVVCRCSAFDSACLALDIAPASIAENRADRRRSIALYLNYAAGAVVTMGGQLWTGEDPNTLDRSLAPTISAPDAASAHRLLLAYRAAAPATEAPL